MNNPSLLLIIFSIIASGIVSFFVAKIVKHYSLKMGIYTLTDGNKIAMWGGLAFVAPMLALAPAIIGISTGQSIIIFLAILSLALFGLLDDIIGFSPFPQLAMQVFVASTLALPLSRAQVEGSNVEGVAMSFTQSHYDSISLLSICAVLVITFALINAMNASNWVDGVDGLAAGVGITSLSILGIFLYSTGDHSYALYSLAFACSLAGFLFFNHSPARLYMGTAGSMGLGLLVALMPATKWELMPLFLCAFALPLGDYVSVIAQRILAGTLPWQGGDRRHLHYRLIDMGWSTNKILLLYIGGTSVFTSASIFSRSYGLMWLATCAALAIVWAMPALFNLRYLDNECTNKIKELT